MILPAKVWRLSGTRPLNHPQRRLAALSMLAREWPGFRRALGKKSIVAANDFFGSLDHPFWKFHYTLTAEASPKEIALIGESRVAEILAKVLFPFWLSEDVRHGESVPCRIDPSTPLRTSLWPVYGQLPARLSNRRLETPPRRVSSATIHAAPNF